MSTSNLTIFYSGPALETGQMGVKELAPALLALGDLYDECNRVLNGTDSHVKVNVKAFESGSFGVSIEVYQGLVEQVSNLFTRDNIYTAAALTQILGLHNPPEKIRESVIWTLKWLKGKKPDVIQELETGNVTLEVGGESITIPKRNVSLLENIKIRKSIELVFKPLKEEGIESLKTSQDDVVNEIVRKEEAPFFAVPSQENIPETPQVTETTSTMKLSLLTVNFKEDNKWRFTDGNNSFYALLLDETFLGKIDGNLISFCKGDILTVKMRMRQILRHTGLETEYEVITVLNHEKPPQLRLPLA